MSLSPRAVRTGWRSCRRCHGEEYVGGRLCTRCHGSGNDDLALAPDGDPPTDRDDEDGEL